MKKNNKFGFTITELILTTLIMSIVCVIAPVIILKRSVKPSIAKKFDFIAKCTIEDKKCVFDSFRSTITTLEGETHTALDYNKNSNDFYTLELVGGGGGGTDSSFGYPGESKTMYLPSLDRNDVVTNKTSSYQTNSTTYKGILTGYYLMEPGQAGIKDESGSPSRICIISEAEAKGSISTLNCNNKIIIAEATGGITSKENADYFIGTDTDIRKSHRLANIISDGEAKYGAGGEKKEEGSGGIIVIK